MLTDSDTARFLLGEWVDVESSDLAAARYDAGGEALEVRYRDGRGYRYEAVSVAEAEDFARAPSHGVWCWDTLRIRGTRTGHRKPYSPL